MTNKTKTFTIKLTKQQVSCYKDLINALKRLNKKEIKVYDK